VAQQTTYYSDYLNLSQILEAQTPLSSHPEEHLFIIVHQIFELWFKQLNYDLSLLRKIMAETPISEEKIFHALGKVDRMNQILSLFGPQLDVLETMTPMDFLEFRDLLRPASGCELLEAKAIELQGHHGQAATSFLF